MSPLLSRVMATTTEREVFGGDFTGTEINDLMSWDMYPYLEGQRQHGTGLRHSVTWRFHGICGARIHISYQYHQSIYDKAKGIPRREPYPVSLMSCVDIDLKHFPDFTPNEDYDIAGKILVIA